MPLRDSWVDKRDRTPSYEGDLVKADYINSVAHAVIDLEGTSTSQGARIEQLTSETESLSKTVSEGFNETIQRVFSIETQNEQFEKDIEANRVGISGLSEQINDKADKESLADLAFQVDTNGSYISELTTQLENKADKKLESGGFAAGDHGNVTGSAIGIGKTAVSNSDGVAIGNYSNAESMGVAIGYGAKSINAPQCIAIGATAKTESFSCIAIGYHSESAFNGVTIGDNALCSSPYSVAVGYNAQTRDTDSIQIGQGTNMNPGTTQIFSYQLLDENGHIPLDRIVLTDGVTGTQYKLAVNDGVLGIEDVTAAVNLEIEQNKIKFENRAAEAKKVQQEINVLKAKQNSKE